MKALLYGGPHDGMEVEIRGGHTIDIPVDWGYRQSYLYKLNSEIRYVPRYDYVGIDDHAPT